MEDGLEMGQTALPDEVCDYQPGLDAGFYHVTVRKVARYPRRCVSHLFAFHLTVPVHLLRARQ